MADESSFEARLQQIGKRREERALANRHHFERLYSNWLEARAIHADPSQDDSDKAADARADRVEAAARLLLSAPVALSWMVFRKWEVMESWLDHEDTSGPTIG